MDHPARPDLDPAPVEEPRNEAARAAFMCGIAAVAALLVPPGLFFAPLLGIAAAVLGVSAMVGWRRAYGEVDRAITGLVLGVVAVAGSSATIWIFRHLIGRVIRDINIG